MDLIADRGRRVTIDELNTTRLLAHARKQAHQRNFDDVVIVDVDAHHYEGENYDEFLPFMENDVLRQLTHVGPHQGRRPRRRWCRPPVGYQDMGGRVTRYPMRSVGKDRARRAARRPARPSLDGRDERRLFLPVSDRHAQSSALHPQKEMEVDLCWAYNRWLTEKVMPEGDNRFFSMLCLPFSRSGAGAAPRRDLRRPQACRRLHGDDRALAHGGLRQRLHEVYRAMEERGLVLSFHSGPNWGEPIFKSCNRFLSAHALGFTWYNVLHCTNWVINGMGERFPKLPVIWIESGLAWVPFLMQRLDHEYMLRPSEAPLLKKKPSDYMRDMFYSSQPMEIQDYGAMECTFRMMNAETQLLYSSDYPHWDFDLPSTIWDLPFLSEKAKHNILGGTAARLFKLPPRNEKQKENLKRFGNLQAA